MGMRQERIKALKKEKRRKVLKIIERVIYIASAIASLIASIKALLN